MGKAEEFRAEQLKAQEAEPVIVAGLREKTDPRLLAEDIATSFDLDPRTAYRWVSLTEERFEKSRKRIARVGLLLLWSGFALALTAVVLRVLSTTFLARPLIWGAAGAAFFVAGIGLAAVSRRLARI